MSSSKNPKHVPVTNLDFAASASEALTGIQQMSKALPLDDVPIDETTARLAGRVPVATTLLAANLVEDNPLRFHGFDAKEMKDALAFEQAMLPVATALLQLHQQVLRNITKRRGASAAETLAVYQLLKGFARRSKSDPTRTTLELMVKQLTTHRKRRATSVTQKEVVESKKTIRKAKVAAANRAKANDALAIADASDKDAGIQPPPPPPPHQP